MSGRSRGASKRRNAKAAAKARSGAQARANYPSEGLAAPEARESAKPERYWSVDALRGFTIFWIVGGDNLVGSIARLAGDQGGWIAAVGGALGTQFQHARWEGFRFYDLIFPMFIFITGISIVLSLGRAREAGGYGAAYSRITRRAAKLFLLGIIVAGGMSQPWPEVRLMGVLQRIAVCYVVAAILFLHMDWRALAATCLAVLVGYWAVLMFVPVPGLGHASVAEGSNLARWLDAHYLPGKRWYGDWDPEGLLSTVPAVASCLIGVLAGLLITRDDLSSDRRSWWLVVVGAACLAVGLAWSLHVPVIKKLWTSSYVLVAGGWSLLLLGLFHWIIDVRGIRRWAAVFVWVGGNAIALYFVQNLVGFEGLAKRVAGGSIRAFFDGQIVPGAGLLVIRVIALALAILLARALYRRGLFLRV